MEEQTSKILIADDDDGDRRQIKRILDNAGTRCICVETANVHDALEVCETGDFDCALIDYHLSGRDGLDGITALHERFPYLAIIMITGCGDETVAAEAIKRGALDYIPKKTLDALSMRRSIESAIEKAALLKTIAEQRNDLEVFSRVLVHDLTSPIHTVLGFAAMIEEQIGEGDSEDIRLYCRHVITGLQRMATLIDTMRRYTSSEDEVAFRPLEMREVITETLANLEDLIRARGARVTYGDMPAVSGSPQLVQLLQNLIGNAIKYCEAEIPLVHVSANPLGERAWTFSVKDNGIGIPAKDYQEVFEPFHRLRPEAKYEGTGLGLATCKKIVERHGGTISCESEAGQGTTFSFTLSAA